MSSFIRGLTLSTRICCAIKRDTLPDASKSLISTSGCASEFLVWGPEVSEASDPAVNFRPGRDDFPSPRD